MKSLPPPLHLQHEPAHRRFGVDEVGHFSVIQSIPVHIRAIYIKDMRIAYLPVWLM